MQRRDFVKALFAGAVLFIGQSQLSACGLAASSQNGAAASDAAGNAESGAVFESRTPAVLTSFNFDTLIDIKAYCPQELLDQIQQRLDYFESIFSRTVEGSDIYLLNHAGGAAVEVRPETSDVIERSLEFSKLSGGLFDISIGAVTSLWDFTNQVVPDPAELARATTHIDYRKIQLDGNTVRLLDDKAMLDLGGIAKGYIADDIVAILAGGGCQSANISLGGNIYALGNKPDGSQWNIGIQDPLGARGDILGSLPITSKSISTSGPYERSFAKDGMTYHHIIDPRTGYPVQTDLASATIISASSTIGDALSTTTFLLGKAAALDLTDSRADLQSILVDSTGQVSCSSDVSIDLL